MNLNSEQLSSDFHKLRTFTQSRQRPRTAVARSKNPTYREWYRYQDATRFNSANSLVAFYQDYPNRQGTPIKPPQTQRPTSAYINQPSQRSKILRSLVQSPPTSQNYKRDIFHKGAQAPLKIGHVPLRIARYPNGRSLFTINDTHSNQTNKAYSRNEYGGRFFTS